MSFSLKISAKDQATGRFKSRVNWAMVMAVVKAKKRRNVTQSQIADKMGVDKSTLSRIINGQGNLTLKTIGDISWALGLRPDITFTEVQHEGMDRANHPAMRAELTRKSDELPRSSQLNKVTITSSPAADRPQASSPKGRGVIGEG